MQKIVIHLQSTSFNNLLMYSDVTTAITSKFGADLVEKIRLGIAVEFEEVNIYLDNANTDSRVIYTYNSTDAVVENSLIACKYFGLYNVSLNNIHLTTDEPLIIELVKNEE